MNDNIPPARDPNLPDFLVIGAMKCGTTSLQHYLSCHPEISMAPKELNFFSKKENWEKGIDWYRQYFDKPGKKQGEVCPGYTKCHLYEGVPQRIYSSIPAVKLIYVLRDPVARIVSHFSHALGEDSTGRSSDEIFNDSISGFVDTSRYALQIEQYLKFFDRDQILIITAESLASDRNSSLQSIFNFLEIDDKFHSDSFDTIFHDSSVKVRRNMFGRFIARMSLLKKIEATVKSFVPRQFHTHFAKILGRSFAKPELSDAQLAQAKSMLGDDLDKLKSITGYAFNEWA